MKITPEIMLFNLREWLDDTYSGATIQLSKTDVGTLLNRIDAQAARIAELVRRYDSEVKEKTRLAFARVEQERRAEAAEKELAALREQKPVGYVYQYGTNTPTEFQYYCYRERLENNTELFSRPVPSDPAAVPHDYFSSLVTKARTTADKAMKKFPQPNYVLLKVAEEAGEVVQAGVHYAEGRKKWHDVEGEIVQCLAMLIRLVEEGDQVNGVIPPEEVLRLNSGSKGDE